MKSGLGGFKNMLIRWRINLKKNKLKNQKIVKYNRLKQFSYNILAIIYFPIGTILNSPKIENKKTFKSPIYKQMIKLEKEITQTIKNTSDSEKVSKQLNHFEQEIQKISNKMVKEKNNEVKENLDLKFKNIVDKKEAIKKIIEQPIIKTNIINNLSNEHQEKVKPNDINPIDNTSKVIDKPLSKENKVLSETEKDLIFVKKTTSKIKEIEEKIGKIHLKIISCVHYNELYDYDQQLKELENKLVKLKEICLNYPYEMVLNINTDPFEIQKSSKKLDSLIENIKFENKNIEIKKDEIYYKKEKTEEKSIEEKQKKEEKTEKKKEEKLVNYIEMAKELVSQNIIKQQELLFSLEIKLKKTKNKRKTLIEYLSGLSKQIIKIMFSFSPFAIIKNKIMASLVSTIFINNSLKTMKKMIRPERKIDYEFVYDIYNDQQMALNNIYRICNNSLDDIEAIRCDIIEFIKQQPDNFELLNLLKQLDSMEDFVIKEKMKAQIQGNIVVKQKTKILEKGA